MMWCWSQQLLISKYAALEPSLWTNRNIIHRSFLSDLPVLRCGSRSQIISPCSRSSWLFPFSKSLQLYENLHLQALSDTPQSEYGSTWVSVIFSRSQGERSGDKSKWFITSPNILYSKSLYGWNDSCSFTIFMRIIVTKLREVRGLLL